MAARKKEVLVAEDNRLNDYELVYIISPDVAEESLESTVDGVSQFITARNGTVSDVERWGKKKLAYPLAHFLEGKNIEAISACEKCIAVASDSFYPYLYKAAAYANLDKIKDAERSVKSLLNIYSSFSIKEASKFFLRKTEHLNKLLDALRKAGLPD